MEYLVNKCRQIMRSFVNKIIFLALASGFAILSPQSVKAASGGNLFRKNSSDTSELNIQIRKALNSFSKTKDVNYLKANIDTAELLCVKANLEFPAALHLARAEYFLLTNDFRNASQEATLAMKKAKNEGEDNILARTMNFLGRYSARTGFYMESITYFENSIEIARKNKIKRLMPKNYMGLADVYYKLGNLKEFRTSLNNLISSAALENDSAGLELGYWRAETRSVTRKGILKLQIRF
jgi:tetratricopeptide (TPR) repeat protein